jgi:hypothetical protein
MIWALVSWLYLSGMGVTYAIDRHSYTLFWFSIVILMLWPLWATLVGLWWCWLAVRDAITHRQAEEITND